MSIVLCWMFLSLPCHSCWDHIKFNNHIIFNLACNVSFCHHVPEFRQLSYHLSNKFEQCCPSRNMLIVCPEECWFFLHFHTLEIAFMQGMTSWYQVSCPVTMLVHPIWRRFGIYQVLAYPLYRTSVPKWYGTLCPIPPSSVWYGVPCFYVMFSIEILTYTWNKSVKSLANIQAWYLNILKVTTCSGWRLCFSIGWLAWGFSLSSICYTIYFYQVNTVWYHISLLILLSYLV